MTTETMVLVVEETSNTASESERRERVEENRFYSGHKKAGAGAGGCEPVGFPSLPYPPFVSPKGSGWEGLRGNKLVTALE